MDRDDRAAAAAAASSHRCKWCSGAIFPSTGDGRRRSLCLLGSETKRRVVGWVQVSEARSGFVVGRAGACKGEGFEDGGPALLGGVGFAFPQFAWQGMALIVRLGFSDSDRRKVVC